MRKQVIFQVGVKAIIAFLAMALAFSIGFMIETHASYNGDDYTSIFQYYVDGDETYDIVVDGYLGDGYLHEFDSSWGEDDPYYDEAYNTDYNDIDVEGWYHDYIEDTGITPFSTSRTVFFNANGGSVSPVSWTRTGGLMGPLPVPFRSGHVFVGWFTSTTGGTQVLPTHSFPTVGNTTIFARWVRAVTITLNPNGGSISVANHVRGANLPLNHAGAFPNPTRPGFTFLGWFTATTGNNFVALNSPTPNANTTFFARWRINVTFNGHGGIVNPRSSFTGMCGMSISSQFTMPTSTRSNHTFVGWYTAQTGGTRISTMTIVPNVHTTYHARWSSTVTFRGNGAPNPASVVRTSGTTIGTLPTLTRTGHNFEGWYTAPTGGTRATANTVVNGHTTFYARWTHTVNLNPQGGNVNPTSVRIQSGTAVGTQLPSPTRTGLTFVAWYTAATGGNRVTATTVVNGHTTYHARWNATVTFNANGGTVTPATRTINIGTGVGTLPVPTRAGHTFVGWFTAQTGGNQITANTVVNNNVTYWARWNVISFTVTFNPNGGTVTPTTRSVNTGAQVGALPTPTRAGFAFVGWFTALTGGSQVAANTAVTSDVTFFARWNATVTFNANGGSVNPTTRVVQLGNTVGSLPTPTRTGHTFLGWFTAQTGGTQVTANRIINSSVTFFARWNATVTFHPNGGSVNPTTRTVQVGNTVGNLPTPARAGHNFVGWFTAQTGGTQITASRIVDGNVTFFARWTVIPSATVTFNPNGGSVTPTTRLVFVGTSVGALPTPTRAGHTFVGWFTSPSGGSHVTTNTIVHGNVTYWARWDISSFMVTFNPNGGSVSPATRAVAGGARVGDLPIPTRPGFAFRGWFSNPNGGIQYNATTVVNSNMTFYAVWYRPNYAITFDSAGGAPVSPAMQSITPGTRIGALPPAPRRQGGTLGQRFVGWYAILPGAWQRTRITANTVAPNENIYAIAVWACNVAANPTRIRYPWWGTNNIPLRTFNIASNLDAFWQTSMNQGMRNWNVSTAPVNFNVTSSSNNRVETHIYYGTRPSLGRIYHTYQFGFFGRYSSFRIRLCPINIDNHARENFHNVGNVIESVMAHELAHAIGLRDGQQSQNGHPTILGGHSNASIMNGGRNRGLVRGPTQFDIASVRLVYDD